mgnify:CR=1 FL=1
MLRLVRVFRKICVPIVGKTIDEILNQAKHICEIGADVVEWRVDWFEEVKNYESVENAAKQLRDILGETPILFTFRTAKEGGEHTIELDEYVELNEKIAKKRVCGYCGRRSIYWGHVCGKSDKNST